MERVFERQKQMLDNLQAAPQSANESDAPVEEEVVESESDDDRPKANPETSILKFLINGDIQTLNRQEEQQRRGKAFNPRHDTYKKTRCISTAQE